MSSGEGNRRQTAAVILHAIERVAAIAEEVGLVRQRVVAGRLDGGPGAGDAPHEVAREIEQMVPGAWRGLEEGGVRLVVLDEAGEELRSHLVGPGADAGTDRGLDVRAPGAEPLHRR